MLKTPDFNGLPNGNAPDGRVTPFGRGIIRDDDGPADSTWADWVIDPHNPKDTDTNYQNGTWMRGWDGNERTYLTPTGTPWVHSMVGEGPYLKTNSTYGAFRFSVDWRVADAGQAATPMSANGEYRQSTNLEHLGNGGVYIYDRYEVQTISSAVPFGQAVPDGGRTADGRQSIRTQLTPGWAYKVDPPSPQNQPVNFSKPAGQWNRMVIEFQPPVVTNTVITQPARLKVYFVTYDQFGQEQRWVSFGGSNGWDLVGADGKVVAGTGNGGGKPPLATGSLFLQSHWGSLVEFKNPVVGPLVTSVEPNEPILDNEA